MSFFENFSGNVAVIGMGATGLAVVRFLSRFDLQVDIFDENKTPKYYNEIKCFFPKVGCHSGDFDFELLKNADLIIVSPGVCPHIKPWSDLDRNKMISDIEIFAHYAQAPVIAITGSNGKSTVCAMLKSALVDMGKNPALGGNFGTPALQLLDFDNIDFYLLELSSFQLELTFNLKPDVAVVLNISEDHLDWHKDFADYLAAKQKIFDNSRNIVVFRGQPEIYADLDLENISHSFALTPPQSERELGLISVDKQTLLMQGSELILNKSDLPLKDRFQILNYLATMAVLSSAGFEVRSYKNALQSFHGLAHRCEYIGCFSERYWYNDSKATNTGAMHSALLSLGDSYDSIVLLAGGVFKEQKVQELPSAVAGQIANIILFGRAADKFYDAWAETWSCEVVDDLAAAIDLAANTSPNGSAVILSPACASFDQFSDFNERGDFFKDYVKTQY